MNIEFAPTQTYLYAAVILPIALKKTYTYQIPDELLGKVEQGMSVEVQFGKSKLYTGVVHTLLETVEPGLQAKPILAILEEIPILSSKQLQFWDWMSTYYACTLGEVMNAAMPANLKLSSDTKLSLGSAYDENDQNLSNKEFLITEALRHSQELSLGQVRKILNQKTVHGIVNKLLDKKIIFLNEQVAARYKRKKVAYVRLEFLYREEPDLLQEAFDLCSKSSRQMEALMAFIQISRKKKHVSRKSIYEAAQVDGSVLKAMAKKGIFELYEKDVSRIDSEIDEQETAGELSEQQIKAVAEINNSIKKKRVCLLHGVTGSGKTRVYMELMQDVIDKGGQVLYLIPEIALTTQIISRLKKVYGNDVVVYHSRLNNNERVEVWKAALAGRSIMVGARSSLFLPFKKLELIIVDEEHDPSYKQIDPAPRYNARDAAVYLAFANKIPAILGTATPSIETYHNVKTGKYDLVEMKERFGGIEMPEIQLVDKRDELKKKKMKQEFTSVLLEEIKNALSNKEQVILFQNRRGYSPTLNCQLCGWKMECLNCDVSLTYHKFADQFQCHYCGSSKRHPESCKACGNPDLNLKGFGTEKIEDDLKILFPEAKIKRLDYDTAKTKSSFSTIINQFEEGDIDILVGTQMITKGLDFENVRVVGVLSADQALAYPDFRASERGFQLITQVAGRAGRKKIKGKVILQSFDIKHPVILEILDQDFQGFYNREIQERKEFGFPPYSRMIKLTLKHAKLMYLQDASRVLETHLKYAMGARVQGPAIPHIGRIRNMYLMNFWIKLEKSPLAASQAKKIIEAGINIVHKTEGCSSTRIIVDVDPY